MNSSTLLKIAFGVILFHLFGHLTGHLTWKETDDAILRDIIGKMDSHEFEFMGKMQTLGGHHAGYSVLFGLMLVTAAWLTFLSWSRTESTVFRPVVLVLGLGLIACGIVETVYFFPLAGGSSLVAGLLYVIVYFRPIRQK